MRFITRARLTALAMGTTMVLNSHISMAHAADLGVLVPPGGWSAAGLQDEQVIKAAHFALQEQSRQSREAFKLLAIKHARQQVVAGINYSMNLMVQSEGKRRLVIAVVWVKPDGSMQLTRWHWA